MPPPGWLTRGPGWILSSPCSPLSLLFSLPRILFSRSPHIQKLSVPSGFSVTSPDKRGWVINPLGSSQAFPVWMMLASVLPAVLVFILIFMETQITT